MSCPVLLPQSVVPHFWAGSLCLLLLGQFSDQGLSRCRVSLGLELSRCLAQGACAALGMDATVGAGLQPAA